jgi:hypothetical protein
VEVAGSNPVAPIKNSAVKTVSWNYLGLTVFHIPSLECSLGVVLRDGQAERTFRRQLLVHVVLDTSYIAGAAYSIDAASTITGVYYYEKKYDSMNKLSRAVLNALSTSGTLSFTAVGRGNREYTSGSIATGSTMVHYVMESCGPNTQACQ